MPEKWIVIVGMAAVALFVIASLIDEWRGPR